MEEQFACRELAETVDRPAAGTPDEMSVRDVVERAGKSGRQPHGLSEGAFFACTLGDDRGEHVEPDGAKEDAAAFGSGTV